MVLYYSGAEKDKGEQRDMNKSLGGFISSSPIPNDSLDSLFSNISNFSIKRNITEYFLIVLKNELKETVENLSIYLDFHEDSAIEMEISVVKPTLQKCNKIYCFESINNRESSPYYVDFVKANGEDNAKLLGNLNPDEYLGFWFKKQLNLNNLLEKEIDYCKLNPLTSKEIIVGKKETFSVVLKWNDLPKGEDIKIL